MVDASRENAIVILGGGASGVLLAAHLLRRSGPGTKVILVEKRVRLGQGLAYSTPNMGHLLNVPASGMSAFADRPAHFLDWLRSSGTVPEPEPELFAPRFVYASYLESLLADPDSRARLEVASAECTGLEETGAGIEVRLDDGRAIAARAAVLAVGHEERQMRGRGLAVRAGSPEDTRIDPYAKVMILGSGLSMVDAWLSLMGNAHEGPILVVSRHGLLPRAHAAVAPLPLGGDEVPVGAELTAFTAWFRDLARRTDEAGGDWRQAVDGLRPFNQRIWQAWPERTRRRFLTHLRPFWNIHRHRLPPHLHQGLSDAIEEGRVTLIAGTFIGVESAGEGVVATVRRRGRSEEERFEIARLYDCGGVAVNVSESSNPLIRHVVRHGIGRPDPLEIGLDVTADCALVGRDGTASRRLFAIGPLTRSVFFEVESVPEIRVQAERLAGRLAALPA